MGGKPGLAVQVAAQEIEEGGESLRSLRSGEGGKARALKAKVVSKREFAGYWEYVLDEAIFTAPAHPNWGGTGLISASGE